MYLLVFVCIPWDCGRQFSLAASSVLSSSTVAGRSSSVLLRLWDLLLDTVAPLSAFPSFSSYDAIRAQILTLKFVSVITNFANSTRADSGKVVKSCPFSDCEVICHLHSFIEGRFPKYVRWGMARLQSDTHRPRSESKVARITSLLRLKSSGIIRASISRSLTALLFHNPQSASNLIGGRFSISVSAVWRWAG